MLIPIILLIVLIEPTSGVDKEICGQQEIPPGQVRIVPNSTIYFDVPLDGNQVKNFTIINTTGCRIAFTNRPQSLKRISVDPPVGVLDPKQAILISIFAYDENPMIGDQDVISVEFTNTPKEATMDFQRYWFNGEHMIRRRTVLIKYLF